MKGMLFILGLIFGLIVAEFTTVIIINKFGSFNTVNGEYNCTKVSTNKTHN